MCTCIQKKIYPLLLSLFFIDVDNGKIMKKQEEKAKVKLLILFTLLKVVVHFLHYYHCPLSLAHPWVRKGLRFSWNGFKISEAWRGHIVLWSSVHILNKYKKVLYSQDKSEQEHVYICCLFEMTLLYRLIVYIYACVCLYFKSWRVNNSTLEKSTQR